MKNIPEKYLRASAGRHAFGIVRRCLDSGATVESMAKQIMMKYADSGDKVRNHLGNLLSVIYDFEAPGVARECAGQFGIEIQEGLTVSQNVFISGCEDAGELVWRRMFSNSIYRRESVVEPFPCDSIPMIVPSKYAGRVLTLDRRENIYAMRDGGLILSILVVEETGGGILADEEYFNDGEPLYFTETSHFVSPVFKARLAGRILEYMLAETGYPYVPVKLKVLFTHPDANLLNAEDYEPGGVYEADWEGVSVKMLKSVLPQYFMPKLMPFLTDDINPDSPRAQMEMMLVYALSATSVILEALRVRGSALSLTSTALRKLCVENGIFAL